MRLWMQETDDRQYKILQDLESKIRNQTELFSKPDTMLAYRQNFQSLSPLLYCNQIQLNDTDVDVTDDELIVVTPTRKIKITYFRHVPPSMVQFCADRYIEDLT